MLLGFSFGLFVLAIGDLSKDKFWIALLASTILVIPLILSYSGLHLFQGISLTTFLFKHALIESKNTWFILTPIILTADSYLRLRYNQAM